MLKSQVRQHSQPIRTLVLLQKPYLHGNGQASLIVPLRPPTFFIKPHKKLRVRLASPNIKSMATDHTHSRRPSIRVKAVVTVEENVASLLSINRWFDGIQDALGRALLLELVSAELDSNTGLEKPTIKGYACKKGKQNEEIKYEFEFEVPPEFGEIGAVLVENELNSEMFLKHIVLDGFPSGPINITCASWVQPKHHNADKRIFFSNKSYLPSQTPSGLSKLRAKELESLRGNGEGEHQPADRIYDYDVYNDIGNPDLSQDQKRPVLGGKERPYPRRCRTGRPRSKADPGSEERSGDIYVPRDEEFSDIKSQTFSLETISTALGAVLPIKTGAITNNNEAFPHFTAIDSIYHEQFEFSSSMLNKDGFSIRPLINLAKDIIDKKARALTFTTPDTLKRDKFFWFRDEEFARETLAGTNPYSIKLVTEWPLKSTLNPGIYGEPESAITTEMIQSEIGDFTSVEEAIKEKKLFILDYNDLLLPYVKNVREIKGTTLYGSRTLFFLRSDGVLKPLAIELTRPPIDGQLQWRQVFRPSANSTDYWLWRLAKAHVLAHDSGVHELISHWLRTHCATEPYVIATHRQLSAMHPIFKLLHPHLRYTMKINALARQALINAGGIIELSFSTKKYSMEFSSYVYDKQWRFDQQGLPKDLISRGMAVEDPSAPHGLRLTIEDYPFANDGLILWDAIKQWVSDYVNHYYPNPSLVESDQELQSWWKEIREVGHGDKKDEPWWPILRTQEDLVEIISTIIWVASGHHAATNFAQYTYGGYFPNRPTIARKNIPTEDITAVDWKNFTEDPENVLLTCFPSQIQATRVMVTLDLLSTHSPDEEYIGDLGILGFEDPTIKGAYERFNARMKELERIVDERNGDTNLKNRSGVGTVPYELLKPFSGPGMTGKGVPFSISI